MPNVALVRRSAGDGGTHSPKNVLATIPRNDPSGKPAKVFQLLQSTQIPRVLLTIRAVVFTVVLHRSALSAT